MIETLEVRKTNLIGKIERLKMALELLEWLECKKLAVGCCTDSLRYSGSGVLQRIKKSYE